MQHDPGEQPHEHWFHGTRTRRSFIPGPVRPRPDGSPAVVGHRGAGALAPPNSVASIRAALAAGASAVELDVRRSPDGTLVLGHGRLAARSAKALSAAEAFAMLRDVAPSLGLVADVKAAGIEDDLAAAVHEAGLTQRTVVCARDLGVLRGLGAADPALPRAWSLKHPRHAAAGRFATTRDVPGAVATALRRGVAEAVAVHYALASPRLIRRVHAEGGRVYVWGLRRASDAEMPPGVDAIIVDDPRAPRPLP